MLKATCCCCWHAIYERPVSPPPEPYGDISVHLVAVRPRPKLVKTKNGYSSCCFLVKHSHFYSLCSMGMVKLLNVVSALLAESGRVFSSHDEVRQKWKTLLVAVMLQGIKWQQSEGGSGKGSRRETISKNNFQALTTWYVFLALNEFTWYQEIAIW